MAEPRRGPNPLEGTGAKAESAAATVLHKVQDVASGVAHKTDDALAAVGSGMSALGGTLGDKGPQSGVLGSAASGVAGGLRATGDYLQHHRMGDMMDDLGHVIRRHPLPSLLVGFGLGFIVARITSRG